MGALIAIGASAPTVHAQGAFSLVGALSVSRLIVNGPAAVAALPNSGVFIAGAAGHNTAEIYNPSSGTFSLTDMGEPYQSATLMQNGAVLLACSGVDNGSG